MKELTARTFRVILSVLLVVVIALITGAFVFGYSYLRDVGQDTAKRQADATASEDSVSSLQQLQAELTTKTDTIERLQNLRSSNSLPQFDTERSLRTIAGQLRLPVKNITFINDTQPSQTTGSASSGNNTSAARPNSTWGSKNSRISFEFGRSLSYDELILFYHAIETSTPKLRLDGLAIPANSKRNSIDPGTLILELATT